MIKSLFNTTFILAFLTGFFYFLGNSYILSVIGSGLNSNTAGILSTADLVFLGFVHFSFGIVNSTILVTLVPLIFILFIIYGLVNVEDLDESWIPPLKNKVNNIVSKYKLWVLVFSILFILYVLKIGVSAPNEMGKELSRESMREPFSHRVTLNNGDSFCVNVAIDTPSSLFAYGAHSNTKGWIAISKSSVRSYDYLLDCSAILYKDS